MPDVGEYKYGRSYLVPHSTSPLTETDISHTIFARHFSRILGVPLKPRILPGKRVYSRSMSRSNNRNARDEGAETELPPLTPQEEKRYNQVCARRSPGCPVNLAAARPKDEGGSPTRSDDGRQLLKSHLKSFHDWLQAECQYATLI